MKDDGRNKHMKKNKVLVQERNRIDGHLHSILSDGENTVAEIIELAFKEGMRMISVTDHNLFAVTKRFEISAGGSCLEVIPGCSDKTHPRMSWISNFMSSIWIFFRFGGNK